MSNTYNGWSNYATWKINLELLDGLSLNDLFYDDDTNINDAYDVGQELKQYIEAIIECDEGNPTIKGYALAFLDEVNWAEIAQNKLDEYWDNF